MTQETMPQETMAEANTAPIKIDIVSDVVCPWCAVGYKHLEKALEQLDGQVSAELEWHPFELNPQMDAAGEPIDEHLINKYGLTSQQLAENKQRLIDAGKSADYPFNFDERSRIFNTFDCHKLLHWANEKKLQKALKLALMEAYFIEGKNISDRDVLLTIVERVGLNKNEAEIVLNDSQYENIVRQEQSRFLQMGIQAVPAFIINNKYLISGGQPVEAFVKALTEISNEA